MSPRSASPLAPPPPGAAVAVAVLLVVAAGLRWLRWQQTAVLFQDGPRFLELAQRIAAGDWAGVFAHPYHPLYSLLVACLQPWLGSWETAAVLVSVAGGTASVLFLYLFLRETFGWPAAGLGAALLAVHYRAVAYASDVQSDGLYLALFLAGLWQLWLALARRSPGRACGVGALAGLAYLARPEGLGLCAVGAAVAVGRTLRGRWRPGELARWLAALCVGAALVAAPYALALRAERGSWGLSQKKSPEAMVRALGSALLGAAEPPRAADARADRRNAEKRKARARQRSPAGDPLRSLAELGRTAKSAARAETLVVLVLGLLAAAGRPRERGALLGSLVLAYAALLFLLVLDVGYVSRRHVLPILTALFGYAGLGIGVLGSLLLTPLRALGRRPGAGLPAAAPAALGLVAVSAVALGHQFEPRRSDERALRRAAEWLRDAAEEGGSVTGDRRASYYARLPYVVLPRGAAAELPAALRERGVRYVVTRRQQLAGALRGAAGTGVRLLHSESDAEGKAFVFEIEPR